MQFSDYQANAATTAIYPTEGECLYPLLGLLGEVGEFAEKMEKIVFSSNPPGNLYEIAVQALLTEMAARGRTAETLKKLLRDRSDRLPDGTLTSLAERKESLRQIDTGELIKELGDCLWYLSALASDFSIDLGEVARRNIDKLFSRKQRGCLQGSGDNR